MKPSTPLLPVLALLAGGGECFSASSSLGAGRRGRGRAVLGSASPAAEAPVVAVADDAALDPSPGPWTMNEAYGAYDDARQRRDWGFVYSSVPPEAVCDGRVVDDVDGKVPPDLFGRGSFFKAGPGNFERNGKKFSHVLDGDGFVAAFSFESDGYVRYTGRFVETEYFLEERDEDRVKYRNVFGTQREGGPLANAFDLTLKNVANTNVLEWGGRLFVFWEAGRPYELDPDTLETLCPVDEDGPLAGLGGLDCKVRGLTIDEGGTIDDMIKVGKSFTAHPHIWDEETLVGFKSETNAQTKCLTLEFVEYDPKWNEKASTSYTIEDTPPPHDFSVSENYYSFFENPYGPMDNTKYLLGMKAPTQIMQLALRQPTKLHIVPRSNDRGPLTVELSHSYFCIHLNGISEEKEGKLHLFSTGWDLTDERFFAQSQDTAPFLGAWGGPYPDFAGGVVPPSLLYETVVDLETGDVVRHEEVRPGIVIEFPTQEADRPNCMYCPIASEDYTSLPGTGLCRIDTDVGEMEVWWAEEGQFTHEVTPVRKGNGEDGTWLLTPLYDASRRRTSLAILDSKDFSSGPVCKLNLKHHVTYGLHGSFSSL